MSDSGFGNEIVWFRGIEYCFVEIVGMVLNFGGGLGCEWGLFMVWGGGGEVFRKIRVGVGVYGVDDNVGWVV